MTHFNPQPKPKKKAKKPKKTVKRYKLSTERNGALHELQRYRVEQESGPNGFSACITCGAIRDDNQGGHFIKRAVRATELEEDNIHPQCPYCNNPRGGNGEPIKYRAALMEKIGAERTLRLENMYFAASGNDKSFQALSPEDQEKVKHKKTATEYHEIREYYKKKRKELKKLRGL